MKGEEREWGEGGKGIKIKNYTQINLDDVFFICFSIYLIIFFFFAILINFVGFMRINVKRVIEEIENFLMYVCSKF